MRIDIKVPTSLKDISLRDYQEWVKVLGDKDANDLFLKQKMIQIFCKVPLMAVERMYRKDFQAISGQLISILKQKPEGRTAITTIDGVKYGFIPNLDDNMRTGEFIDLNNYLGDWENYHKAMAVLYRPVKVQKKEKYQIEPYQGSNKYADKMLDMNMHVAIGAIVFFYRLGTQLLSVTPKYLEAEMMKNQKIMKDSGIDGDGIVKYTNLLEEACSKFKMLLNYTWGQPFTSLPMNKTLPKKLETT